MRKQIKPFFLYALLAILVIGLTACSPGKENDSADIQTQPKETPLSNTFSGNEAAVEIPQSQGTLPAFHCTDTNPHPMGQSIAETYENVSYEQVMIWFCEGYVFDDILVALETSAATDIPASDLLEMLWEKSWEEIWQATGLLEE